MGAATGRLIGPDITALQLDTTLDIVAKWESGTISINRPGIDVTAVGDAGHYFEDGKTIWSVRTQKLIFISDGGSQLGQKVLAGGSYSFTCTEALTGKTITGKVRFESSEHNLGGIEAKQFESCVLQGIGVPTIT